MSNRGYSVSVDFPSGVNLVDIQYDVQQQEAGNGGSLSTTLSHINILDDTLTMYFDAVITTGDETILDTVVTNYVFTPLVYETRKPLEVNGRTVSSTAFTNVAYFTYRGELYDRTIVAFNVITTATARVDSYTIRIFDDTNALVIAQEAKTEEVTTVHRLETLNNIPKKEALILIQVAKVGGTIDDAVTVNAVEIVTSP